MSALRELAPQLGQRGEELLRLSSKELVELGRREGMEKDLREGRRRALLELAEQVLGPEAAAELAGERDLEALRSELLRRLRGGS